MNFIKKNWKGVLLCLMIAIPSWILGKIFPIVGGPVFAILLGMVITLLVSDKSALQSGITFVSKKILQYAVILLGFGMNLSVILQTGKQSLPIILATITTSLVVAWVLHKILHVPGKISTLIGVGSSICGGSAIAATAPVIDADDEEVAQSISVIFFFNMLAALFFPIGHFFQKIQRHTRIRHKESQQPHHSTPFLLCVCLPVRRRIMGYLSFVGIRYVDLRTILVVAFLGNHSLGNDLSQPTVMVPYGSF